MGGRRRGAWRIRWCNRARHHRADRGVHAARVVLLVLGLSLQLLQQLLPLPLHVWVRCLRGSVMGEGTAKGRIGRGGA